MEAGETAAPVNILEDDNEEEIESGEDFLEKALRPCLWQIPGCSFPFDLCSVAAAALGSEQGHLYRAQPCHLSPDHFTFHLLLRICVRAPAKSGFHSVWERETKELCSCFGNTNCQC